MDGGSIIFREMIFFDNFYNNFLSYTHIMFLFSFIIVLIFVSISLFLFKITDVSKIVNQMVVQVTQLLFLLVVLFEQP